MILFLFNDKHGLITHITANGLTRNKWLSELIVHSLGSAFLNILTSTVCKTIQEYMDIINPAPSWSKNDQTYPGVGPILVLNF